MGGVSSDNWIGKGYSEDSSVPGHYFLFSLERPRARLWIPFPLAEFLQIFGVDFFIFKLIAKHAFGHIINLFIYLITSWKRRCLFLPPPVLRVLFLPCFGPLCGGFFLKSDLLFTSNCFKLSFPFPFCSDFPLPCCCLLNFSEIPCCGPF